MSAALAYTGRFAPTPSGRLHMGSLVTAVGAWLRAASCGGSCLLRLEDLDRPRCPVGMSQLIISDLTALALMPEGNIRQQSEHLPFYTHLIDELIKAGIAYVCRCTRAERHSGRPCHCQNLHLADAPGTAVVLRRRPFAYTLTDPVLGKLELCYDGAPVTLRRTDGIIAYNLSTVADDLLQEVTEAVRGADLLPLAAPQEAVRLSLCEISGHPYTPQALLHLPLVTGSDGRKLSKQNHAQAALENHTPSEALLAALALLKQDTRGLAAAQSPSEILRAAAGNFDLNRIPRTPQTLP